MHSTLMFAGGVLALIALAHSALGEKEVLRPLFRQAAWSIPDATRPQARALLRFAWHLTTLAWLGLGAVLLGAPAALVFGFVALVSGATILVMLRGHLAWPMFLVAGLSALHGGGFLPDLVPRALTALAVVIAVGVAGLHVYWAAGGTAALAAAVPQRPDGRALFAPGRIACTAVAVALLVLAALLALALQMAPPLWLRWMLGLAASVLTLRVIGDTRFVGFLKRYRSSPFGRADDSLYTPLVVALWLGTLAGLSTGGGLVPPLQP